MPIMILENKGKQPIVLSAFWRFESAGRGWIELLGLGFLEVSEDIVLVTCKRFASKNQDYIIRFSSPVSSQLRGTLFGENDFDQSKWNAKVLWIRPRKCPCGSILLKLRVPKTCLARKEMK